MVSNDKSRTGLSLYANLLNTGSSNATISSAPVSYKKPGDAQNDADTAQRNAALRFQPTKRLQQASQKPKPKPSVPRSQSSITNTSSPGPDSNAPPAPSIGSAAVAQIQPKSTLADWTADDDDVNGFYTVEKAQRGGRKKRKKNKEEAVVVQDWDDIYDPSRPNSYEDYKHSEERYREIREWKDKLYRHRIKRRASDEMSEDEKPSVDKAFAPPSAYSFAPPPTFDSDSPSKKMDEEGAPPKNNEDHYAAPPAPQAASIPEDASGEDAYTRRMRLSGKMATPVTPAISSPAPPPPPLAAEAPGIPPPPPPELKKPSTATISSAPVRYSLPPPPPELPTTDAELEAALADADAQEDEDGETGDGEAGLRSNRPGKKGFAQRLMSKYGWTKGAGLGAGGTGIVNPLKVQVEKRKKKSDAEGGGWVGPSAKGRIIGSKTGGQGKATEDSDALRLSEVVILRGMVDGMDLDHEMTQGTLMEDIGFQCGDKYGRVERIYIHRASTSPSIPVFIKFTSQLSALRAVGALQGTSFNGNTIQASYFDAEKFDEGVFE